MPPLRVLIVDDEPLARERLRGLLRGLPDVVVAGECRDGAEAVAALRDGQADLVFLDVQMPGLDGFDVIRAVGPAQMPAVVFVTAYDRALQAFEVHALDYLLKPFQVERFTDAVARAVRLVRQHEGGAVPQRLESLLADLKPAARPAAHLLVRTRARVYFVPADEIDYVESAGNYVRLHAGRQVHLLRQTMNTLEAQLDPERFLRIHRSYIVNIGRVQELRPVYTGEFEVLLKDGTRLTMSRGYRSGLDRFAR
jgi:two-component system LytT family response regulator